MLVTSHVLAGQLLGRALPQAPAAAFTVGVASHLAMDALPHWGLPGGTHHPRFFTIARRDGLAGLAAMGASLAVAPRGARRAVLAGMLGAALLDLDKPVRHFLGCELFPTWIQDLHAGIQDEAPHRLPHEVAVAALLATTLLLCRLR